MGGECLNTNGSKCLQKDRILHKRDVKRGDLAWFRGGKKDMRRE